MCILVSYLSALPQADLGPVPALGLVLLTIEGAGPVLALDRALHHTENHSLCKDACDIM